MTGSQSNWAGNVTFAARACHRPSTLAELQRLVAGSRKARALGTGHSFSQIADTTGDLISVAGLPRHVQIDGDTVTISAGLRYGELAAQLDQAGRALRNLGSLPHISVAGSCATGTHGSGDANGVLATSVRAWEMVTADGDVITADRAADPDSFPGTVVALGSLGIVTRLTLDTVPSFGIRQYVYEDLPRERVARYFDEISAAAYSVSLFTDWRGPGFRQAWLKCRDTDPAPAADWMGGRPADGPRNPVPGVPATHTTQQLGVPGSWYERLPHFRLEFTPSAGDELQSEYLLPRSSAADALVALGPIAGQIAPVLQISEIRTVAADELWLSPCYQRDSVAFHFTWIKDWAAVSPVLAEVEERLAPLAARPHWGKLFHASPAPCYERMDDFRALMRHYDPAGKFRNAFVDRYIAT